MFDAKAIGQDFGRAAEVYDAQALLQRQVRDYCLALAHQYWPKGTSVLDAGCGTFALAEEGWRVTGLDLAFGMCRIARRKDARIVNADAQALPFADESFGGVFSSLMLQWASDSRALWQEFARVLKPGGYAVISTLAEDTLQELRDAFAVLDNAPHVSNFAPAHAVVAESAQAGLTLISARQAAVVEHYPDAVALMRALQAIGAANKQENRRRGLMTSRQLSRVEQTYERFRESQGLPATWQVLTLVVQKA